MQSTLSETQANTDRLVEEEDEKPPHAMQVENDENLAVTGNNRWSTICISELPRLKSQPIKPMDSLENHLEKLGRLVACTEES
jgi:hypothetical protein